MKIDYTPIDGPVGRGGKYPWDKCKEIGDYFDVPLTKGRGIKNSAHARALNTGYIFRTFTVRNTFIRVMLIDIEEGACIVPRIRSYVKKHSTT